MKEVLVAPSLVMKPQSPPVERWAALDILRGLSVIGMLLALSPGAWDRQYSWLIHAAWEGGTLVDMVAPVFLFCIGAAIPLSMKRRLEADGSRRKFAMQIVVRSSLLILIGLFLNAYPDFDMKHLRIPGVLQRIGVGFGLTASLMLLVSKPDSKNRLSFNLKTIASIAFFILVTYWVLLYAIPVPGHGAPRFDPVHSWPPIVDRAVFTPDHMFKWWPVDGQVTFDPDGLVSTYPVLFNILMGAVAGGVFLKNEIKHPLLWAAGLGLLFMGLAIMPGASCPIIKNIWTSTFAMFSVGFALTLLAGLSLLCSYHWFSKLCVPVKVFGANPLVAYILVFVLMPLFELPLIDTLSGKVSVRWGSQLLLKPVVGELHASFMFSIFYLSFIFGILWFLQRKGWFLRV